ncbi:MAG: V-type ATP synthase subunit I [Acetivibrionales bacterium]|jgi:V/A-type H+-transporting ATPase subunit I
MAVIKMNKITVLGLSEERSALLKSLLKLGVLEINQEEPQEDFGDKTYNINVLTELADIDENISQLERAIDILSRYAPVKKPFLSARRIISEADYNQKTKEIDKILSAATQIISAEDDLSKLKGEENNIRSQLDSIEPWLKLDIPLELTDTRYTFFQTGSLPGRIDVKALDENLKAEFPESGLLIVKSDEDIHYAIVFGMKVFETELMELLRGWGWNRITIREGQGTAQERKTRLKAELKNIEKKRENGKALIIELAKKREELEIISDALQAEKARVEAKSRLLSTKSTFLLKGWLPAEHSAKVEEYINKHFFCAVTIEEPAKDEEFPVLLKNGPIVEAINPIVEMYGLPSSLEIDPRAITLPFYIFMFGLMLGDGGYGILIALATGFALKKYRMEDSTRQFIKLLFLCGLSTILAGFLFGSWFGIASLAKTALWIVPTEKPELMMSYSILIGIIHMYAGMFMKALNYIRRGQILDAIFDVGFGYIMLTGFIMILLPFAPGLTIPSSSPIVQAGYYVFAIGVGLVLLTAGRSSKNIFGKIFGGLPRLYDIVGFFSDCLSYTRILALGLASAIIGDIVNTLATSFGDNFIIRITLTTAVLLFGHTLNFALNALGAYVHSCRLQFLEFFGKFLEGGGVAFNPFKAKTKYVVVDYESTQFLNSGSKSGIV